MMQEDKVIRLHGSTGQITIFLATVLMSVVILAGVLIDATRLFTAEKQIKRAVESAARSALASYCSRLKDEYGLFGIYPESEARLHRDVDIYMRQNLMTGDEIGQNVQTGVNTNYADFYDYRIESLSVQPMFNFADNKVVRNQIIEYMKFRAPQRVLEGVWEKLSSVGESSMMAQAYKKKANIDIILGRMSKAQQSLKINIDGTTGDANFQEFYICKFNKEGIRENAIENIARIFQQYKNLLNMSGSLDDGSVAGQLRRLRKELENGMKDLRRNHTEAFFKPNEQAEKSIKEIMKLSNEAEAAIRELEHFMDDSFVQSGTPSQQLKDTITDDIAELKELIQGTKEAETLLQYTANNRKALKVVLENLNEAQNLIDAGNIGSLTAKSLDRKLNNGTDGYFNMLKYDYKKPSDSKSGIDNREEAADELESLLYERASGRDIKESGINIEELPSHKKVETNNYDEMNVQDVDYPGSLKNLSEEVNFLDENTAVIGNALSFVSSIDDVLSRDLASLRDDIYINEYIMGVFKNSVPSLENGSDLNFDADLRGVKKSERQTFFQSEVEYVLNGNSSERINRIMTEAQILLIRFVLNTLHVYSDSNKRELANGTAVAAVGWWSGGAAVPAVAHLIMCGWGMGEAIIDVKDLLDGQAVPFYKSPGDWKLDIGLPQAEGKKSDKKAAFSYYDYLRLLLLLRDTETKLGRVEDLVELNMQNTHAGFKMEECSMYAKVEAEVSVKYLFMTRPFMPQYSKTADGRHRFKVVVYEGY